MPLLSTPSSPGIQPPRLPDLELDSPKQPTELCGMSDRIRIIKHRSVPKTGSFEVRFPDGRPSKFFYWDDEPSRHLNQNQVDSKQALRQAKTFARSSAKSL